MSDAEGGKKSGYRLEYAASSRAKCNGPKPCKGTPIGKGELRMGTLIDVKGNTNFSWRHWGCVTPTVIKNMKKSFEEADELDGFEDLNEDDQERLRKAWEDGKVADEDVPETARKPDDGDEEDDQDDKPKKKAAAKVSKKKEAEDGDGKGVFKLEYASSGRAKCKVCTDNIGKNFFRLGQEADFRGNKTMHWRHWGCSDAKTLASLKSSYSDPSEVDGFSELKPGEQDKVRRAWEEDAIPEEDQGAGEAVDTGKKAPVRRKKKVEEDGDEEEKPKKARGRKPKVNKEEDDDEDEEEKPKPKRAAAKKAAPEKGKAAVKKRAPAKKRKASEDEESGEDFGDEIAAVGADEDDEEEQEEPTKKRKRAPPSKASASKPPSKRAKPASSRSKKKQEEIVEESELEESD